MLSFPRHRIARQLRVPALALLAFAMLLNLVFAAIGDLHESSSHGSVEHAQPVDFHDDADTREQGLDLLHALMHAAHCCGHLTAILTTAFVAPAPLAGNVVSMPAFDAPSSPPRTDPFRPPIPI